MIWPELVPDKVCKTECEVIIYEETLSEEGAPIVVLEAALKCNFQDQAKRIYTKEQKIVQLTGSAYFNGDIAPDVPVISSGKFKVFGKERDIYRGTKSRNPDGSVNFTLLEVI